MLAFAFAGCSDDGGMPGDGGSADASVFDASRSDDAGGVARPHPTATFDPETRISVDDPAGATQREPSIGVTSRGAVHVVYMNDARIGGCRIINMSHVTAPDGRTLGVPVRVACPDAVCGDPVVLVDSADRVFLVYMDVAFSGPGCGDTLVRHVMLTRLDVPGAVPVQVDDDPAANTDRPWAAVDAEDRIWVTWVRGFHDADREIRLSMSSDRGASFGPSTHVAGGDAAEPNAPMFAPIAVAPDGDLHVAVARGQYDTISVRGFDLARAPAGSTAFEARSVPEVREPRPVCSDATPECADLALAVYGFAGPSIDVAPDGTVWVLWGQQQDDPGDVHMMAGWSRDGLALESTTRVDDGATPALRMLSWLDVDERGRAHALWLDLRNATAWQAFHGVAAAPGETFHPNTVLSAIAFGGSFDHLGEFVAIASRGDAVLAAWSGKDADRTRAEEIFFARGTVR